MFYPEVLLSATDLIIYSPNIFHLQMFQAWRHLCSLRVCNMKLSMPWKRSWCLFIQRIEGDLLESSSPRPL